MKKLVYFLALCFLLEWAYTTKIKPFVMAEFGIGGKKNNADSSNQLAPGNDVDADTGPGGTANTGSKISGIDVSHWEKLAEMETVLNKYSANLSFVICKATDGSAGQDSEFMKNWGLLVERPNIKRGAYHFYRCSEGASAQAVHYYNTLRAVSYSPKDLPPIIDFEVDTDPAHKTNSSCLNNAANIRAIEDSLLTFLNIIQKLTRRTPIIYTNDGTGNKLSNPALSAYPLWIANYANVKAPVIPKALNKNWSFWQSTDKYAPVQGDTLDFDVFHGNSNSFKKFINTH
jgi:lysozyme